MRRYVILEHDHPFLHWDLMIEWGDHLKTWRLFSPPNPGESVRAEPLAQHRLMYLDYEGPVSGGRGTVTQWDAGRVVEITEYGEACIMRILGRRLYGTIRVGPTDEGGLICSYSAAS